ncbi:MAG: HEAT repeat domain-containing protein, partial [Acidobacteriota bacterium]|nr:HEAT repeat domain-containing protein [Acidobacteriota bacterium]
MNYKYIFIFVALCFYSLSYVQTAKAQQPSSELINAVPQFGEKINSAEIQQRIDVLDKLIVYKWDYDLIKTILPFNLSAEDYAYVIRKVFEKDLTQVDEKIAHLTLSRIEFLTVKFKLKEFAKNLAEYIPKFMPNGMDFPRLGIQNGILGALEALQAKEFAPQIAMLLRPDNKVLHHEVLSTLIALRAKEAIPALLSLLYDKDYSKRFYALESLVKINGREAAPHIAKLLEDEVPSNRYWALDALVKLNAREQSTKIWKLVNSKQTQQTEVYAIAALVYFGNSDAVQIAAKFISEGGEKSGIL